MTHRIAVIPGDGIGKEVAPEGVRAVEAAQSHPAIDAERIAVCGGSQGGGISIAVAGPEEET